MKIDTIIKRFNAVHAAINNIPLDPKLVRCKTCKKDGIDFTVEIMQSELKSTLDYLKILKEMIDEK